MTGEIRYHRAQCSTECAHISRHRAAAGSGRFARSFFSEALHRHFNERFVVAVFIFEQIFDHFLARVERFEVRQTERLNSNLNNVFFRNTRGALLLFEEVASGFKQRAFRHKTYDFRTRNAYAPVLSTTTYLIKGHVKRRHIDIRDIHRHLCDAIFFNIPTDALCAFQRARDHDFLSVLVELNLSGNRIALACGAAFFAHIKRDSVSAARRRCVQVIVYCDQEVACTDIRAARASYAFVEWACAEVGRFSRIVDPFRDRLILTSAHYRQVFALRLQSCGLITVARDLQFVSQTLCQFASQFGALFQRNAGNGNERQHVRGAAARVCTVVLAHIDQLRRLAHCAESSFHYRIRFAHKGNHCAVCSFSRVHIKQTYACRIADLVRDLLDNTHIAPFTKIGHALDKLLYFCHRSLDFIIMINSTKV